MAISRTASPSAPDGLLYLSSGDRQKMEPAQADDGNLGKVLRLTPEGAPAPGNPWAAKGGVAAQFWSMGHRNVLGLAFAPDGRLWENRDGAQGRRRAQPRRCRARITAGRVASNGSHYDGPRHPRSPRRRRLRAAQGLLDPVDLARRTADLQPATGSRRGRAMRFVPALSGEALIRVDIDGAARPRPSNGRWARASARSSRAPTGRLSARGRRAGWSGSTRAARLSGGGSGTGAGCGLRGAPWRRSASRASRRDRSASRSTARPASRTGGGGAA